MVDYTICYTHGCSGSQTITDDRRGRAGLKIYEPSVAFNSIYFPHPGTHPVLRYNHDVDIVKYRDRFIAAWNANEEAAENVPGQFNFLSVSDDFERWSTPTRMFTGEGGSENPIEDDNQWQPSFINYHDETLFCAWCTLNGGKTFVSSSTDGIRWNNREVAAAPPSLEGEVVGFPTNHGLRTREDVMLFPCSLPIASEGFLVGRTRFAAMLISTNGGASWEWSAPIEAVSWSELGEDPLPHGGEMIALWEPAIFEQADGSIGLLIRNSSSQENPERDPYDKPHQMILYANSKDQGRTWSRARPIEVDSLYSRSATVSGIGTPESLLMVMNDMNVNVPQRISHDRYFLTLFCAPVCDPDLLLPGPIVQPEGGRAFYPNAFVEEGRLYAAYTHSGIHASVVDPLPDFSEPFLLPRAARTGLRIDRGVARFGQPQSCLSLVLTADLTRQARLRLSFESSVHRYTGAPFPILTLGGKTRQGATIRAVYRKEIAQDVFQVGTTDGVWRDVAPFTMKEWNRFEIEIGVSDFSLRVGDADASRFDIALLRKICFGGLYETPEWPVGMREPQDVRLNLDSLRVE